MHTIDWQDFARVELRVAAGKAAANVGGDESRGNLGSGQCVLIGGQLQASAPGTALRLEFQVCLSPCIMT